MSQTTPQITRAEAKDKIIDFRDNLVLSADNDYAMMHCQGETKRGYKSTIKCAICDYTKGKGDKSVTAYANLSVETIYYLYNAAKQVMVQQPIPINTDALNLSVNNLAKLYKSIGDMAANALPSMAEDKNLIKFINAVKKEIGANGAKIRDYMVALNSASAGAGKADFEYSQDRVDVYRKDANSTAPVSIMRITHAGTRSNGAKSKFPWYIKITNGTAPVKEMPNGTTSYEGSKLKIDREASINVSDFDMFRMMLRIKRFIETWENSYCIKNIQNGHKKRDHERMYAVENRM